MLVREWGEGDWGKASALQPMDGRRVYRHGFLGGYIWTILEVVVLSFLLGFEVETCQSTKVLLTDGFVDGGTAPDSLSVVMGRVCPPIGFGLDVTKDHVLYGDGQPGNLVGEGAWVYVGVHIVQHRQRLKYVF